MQFKKSFSILILVVSLVLNSAQAGDMGPKLTADWWRGYRQTHEIDPDLRVMVDYFVDSSLIADCSEYWLRLSGMNLTSLIEKGFDSFQAFVCSNYFTFPSVDNSTQWFYSMRSHSPFKLAKDQLSKRHSYFSVTQSCFINRSIESLLKYVDRIEKLDRLNRVEPPLVGSPPYVDVNGTRVTQDGLNAFIDYWHLSRVVCLENVRSVLEVGAGMGRHAFTLLKFHPDIKYIIVDIPPALYISQTYLQRCFPEKKAFKFRPFAHFEEISEEFSKADICFITPDQLHYIPDQSIDLFMAIDCLHEMKKSQVQYYFDSAHRLARYFYYKNWTTTIIPFDDICYTEDSYPVYPEWKLLLKQKAVFPPSKKWDGMVDTVYQLREPLNPSL